MSQNEIPTDDRHWSLIALRIAAIVTSLPLIPCLAWAITEHEHVQNDGIKGEFDSMALGAISYAFVWSAIVLIIRLFLRTPIHPGIYVAFDFLAFGVVISMTLVLIVWIEPFIHFPYACEPYNAECAGDALRKVEWFSAIMALINGVIHMVLFIRACWACHLYRKQAPKGSPV